MIYLVPFDPMYTASLCAWVKSEEDLVLFSGPLLFQHPLTEEQFNAYINNPTGKVFAALDNYTNTLVGMGEIVPSSENTVRLCRILVGSDFRGRGYGQLLTLGLMQEAFADPLIQRVELNVYDFNKAAIRCYEHCGFQVDETDQNNPSNWRNWRGIRMFISREKEYASNKE